MGSGESYLDVRVLVYFCRAERKTGVRRWGNVGVWGKKWLELALGVQGGRG